MILVSQGNNHVYFAEDDCHIAVMHEQIVLVRDNGKTAILGEYHSSERAREVFYEAINELKDGAAGLIFKED